MRHALIPDWQGHCVFILENVIEEISFTDAIQIPFARRIAKAADSRNLVLLIQQFSIQPPSLLIGFADWAPQFLNFNLAT